MQLKDTYLHDTVEKATPFTAETKDKLNRMITHVIALYAKCVTRGDTSAATKQLKIHQREQVRLLLAGRRNERLTRFCAAFRLFGNATPSGGK